MQGWYLKQLLLKKKFLSFFLIILLSQIFVGLSLSKPIAALKEGKSKVAVYDDKKESLAEGYNQKTLLKNVQDNALVDKIITKSTKPTPPSPLTIEDTAIIDTRDDIFESEQVKLKEETQEEITEGIIIEGLSGN
jgi:hypothetical protein